MGTPYRNSRLACHQDRYFLRKFQITSPYIQTNSDWTTPDSYGAPNNRKHVELLIALLSNKEAVTNDAAVYEPLSASEVFSATPITEILTLLVPSSMSSEDVAALMQVSSSTAPRSNGVKAVTHAWLTDEINHPSSPTGKAKGLRFFLAWPNLEVHRGIMAEEGFRTNMGAIKEKCLPSVHGRGMFHAEFKKVNSY
jgi:hypothetical protein